MHNISNDFLKDCYTLDNYIINEINRIKSQKLPTYTKMLTNHERLIDLIQRKMQIFVGKI